MMLTKEQVMIDPEITDESRRFWEEASQERLTIGKCDNCGEAYFYPRARCPFCLSSNTRLVTASGEARIYSYSVVRSPIPYVMALVTLIEGPTILSNIVNADPAALVVEQSVRLTFVASQAGQKVPVFETLDGARQYKEQQ